MLWANCFTVELPTTYFAVSCGGMLPAHRGRVTVGGDVRLQK